VTATLGSALIAAVAYIDPGNVATNVTAGARYGTLLLWVVVAASTVGMLVQYLSAKLGLAAGRSLPELCRERMPPAARTGMWLQAELVVIMTDLAEVVGGALALRMMFGLPLPSGAVLMVAAAFGVLALRVRGQAAFRPVVYVCLAVVAAGFVSLAARSGLTAGHVGAGFRPALDGIDSAYLSAGIVGATVMPHIVYLHSDLTKQLAAESRYSVRQLIRNSGWEVIGAMLLAAVVNVAIMLAATVLTPAQATSLITAHTGFTLDAGVLSGWVFGSALLASSLASTCVGVYSGQTIMQGFLKRRISLWARRGLSVLPALVVLGFGLDATGALVLSQVVLSFGIPFALAPLIWFTSDRITMGPERNHRGTIAVAMLVLGCVIGLNGFLLWTLFS
jgi:manganese transport protein